jgi:hypothetical protein
MPSPREIIEGILDYEESTGEFIRNGPSTGLPGYVRDTYRQRCNQFAHVPFWAKLLTNGALGSMDRICTPYWNDNGWDGPVPGVPAVIGGQCEERYEFVATTTRSNPTVDEPSSLVANGPITGTRVVGSGTPDVTLEINCRGVSGGFCFNSFPPVQPQGWYGYRGGSNITWTTPVISGLSRCSGSGDPCGDSPVEGPSVGPNPPPDPGPITGPEPTDDPDNPTGPPLIPLPPYQDPVYGPTPIVGPTGPTGPPGGGGGNDPVGGPGSPGDGGDTGEGGDESGEAEDGEELVGVLVQVLSAPTDANRFFNNAAVVYRGAYYVAMGYPGRLGLDMSGGTAETVQFFHAQQRGLTDYRVRANVGFNLRVTPYYRILEP